MKKLIEIEFKDGFVPPEYFSQSGGKCEQCPFRVPQDDDYPYCQLREWYETYHQTYLTDCTCPIKKYFDNTNEEEV